MDTFSGKKSNPYENLSEEKLISKSKKGDTKAFDELIERYDSFIHGCINSFLKGKTQDKDIDEIYQLALIKSWRYIKGFRGDCKFSTWINRILRNLFYDDYRRKQRRKETSYEKILEDSGHESIMPTVKADRCKGSDMKFLRKIIDDSLKKLSDNHKKVLILAAEEELTYSEIAELTKCSVGTVMSRLFYARKQFKKHFSREKAKYLP